MSKKHAFTAVIQNAGDGIIIVTKKNSEFDMNPEFRL